MASDDVSGNSHIAQPSHPYVGWGTGFFDMDNSGWLDIFVANGHVYPQVDTIPDAAHFRSAYPAVPQQSGWNVRLKLHPPRG